MGEISQIMGKTRVSVKSKLFNSGLNSVKGATGVEKSVAVAVVASSPGASPAVPASASVAAAPVEADLKVPERLPSVEEELKVLSAAMAALRQPRKEQSLQFLSWNYFYCHKLNC